jgi:hypothetical protein
VSLIIDIPFFDWSHGIDDDFAFNTVKLVLRQLFGLDFVGQLGVEWVNFEVFLGSAAN